ncbi:NrfD/PsrC family molybdoenzyme membrane anchor subunit [Planctomycetota bacterium]
MDPKVNGQLQKEWSWLIAVYLFLGGVGSGAYTIAAFNGFLGDSMELSTTLGLWIALPALLIGSACLMADLGNPGRAFMAGFKPGSSWIARGFWIITIFMLIAFVHLFRHQFTDYSEVTGSGLNLMGFLGIIFGIMTMAYTGILLGASKGIPFWRSAAVPLIFVISALVTGAFIIMVFLVFAGAASELRVMALEASVLLVAELLALFFFLQAAYRQPDARESVERLIRKRMFVIGDFILGLLVPLALMLLIYFAMEGSSLWLILPTAFIGAGLGLAGGLLLRQAVLSCGALPTLNFAGFKFRRIERPKMPKPGIDTLPPQ